MRKLPLPVSGLLLMAVLFSCFFPSWRVEARKAISMYIGEVQVLELKGIERVALGNPKVVSNTILPKGQLVLLADAEGVTTMHIWFKDGSEQDFDVAVQSKEILDVHQELVHLLADIPGISVSRVGDLSVVKGNIALQDKRRYDLILARYKEVLDLVTVHDTISDVSLLLATVPGVAVKEVGGNPVITGEVSDEYAGLIKIIESKYPNILNLTRVHKAVAGKMVYMRVRIMEMNKSLTENLGIDWNLLSGIAGPSFEFGVETSTNNATILNNDRVNGAVPGSLAASGNSSLHTATGYFGIATGLGSIINLYEGTGDAVVLAEPRLSTRSGGTAEFLAGGEYPVPATSTLGAANVEFKKYGISLNIAPIVDDQGNILAHIETEISTIDQGTAVNNIPGVLTRRTNTDVSLRAEQTLVIAGLVQDLANKDYDKVKWLGDIPILGPLFKSEKFNNKQTELVIFITPSIYDASSELNKISIKKGEEISERLEKLIEGKKLLE